MKKLLLSFILLISISTLSIFAQQCNIQDWQSKQIYLAGNQVKYNGIIYEAKWWVQNSPPTANPDGPWHFVNVCNTEIIDPSSCHNTPTWSNAQVYLGGETVQINSIKYQSSYYNVNTNPELNFGETTNTGKPWIKIGICDVPNISLIGSLNAFTTEVGVRSALQTFTLSAANLNTVLNLTAPANFELALNENGPWQSSISLNPTTGGVLPTQVYVAYNPNGLGNHHGDLVISSQNASPLEIPITGAAQKFTHVVCNSKAAWNAGSIYNQGEAVVYNGKLFSAKWWTQGQTPNENEQSNAWLVRSQCVYTALTINPTELTPFATLLGTPSATQTITLNATDVFDFVKIEAPNHFEISLTENGIYSNSISLEPVDNQIQQIVYVRYNPASAGHHVGNVLISTVGLPVTAVIVQGNSSPLWQQTGAQKAELNLSIKQLGIGTSNVPSSYMMAVDGKILARGLKIQADGWADFVFNNNYELMPLEEVDDFITTNKHLPNIPSEKEITTQGIDTAEMLRLQMQKIEELTLYLIEIQKQNKALENRIKQLEADE